MKLCKIKLGEASPVWIKVIGGFRVKDLASGEEVSDPEKLSYRAKTEFGAFLIDEKGIEKPVPASWTLVPVSGWEIKPAGKRAKILDHLGINPAHHRIGYLPGSSSVRLETPTTLFSSLFSGKADLLVEHADFSKTVPLSLFQPTVWFNFKTVEGSDYSEEFEKKALKTAQEVWGIDNLIQIENRKEFSRIKNIFMASLTPSVEYSEIYYKSLNPLSEPSLLNPLGLDFLQFHEDEGTWIVPRQSKLLLENRSSVNSQQ